MTSTQKEAFAFFSFLYFIFFAFGMAIISDCEMNKAKNQSYQLICNGKTVIGKIDSNSKKFIICQDNNEFELIEIYGAIQ